MAHRQFFKRKGPKGVLKGPPPTAINLRITHLVVPRDITICNLSNQHTSNMACSSVARHSCLTHTIILVAVHRRTLSISDKLVISHLMLASPAGPTMGTE